MTDLEMAEKVGEARMSAALEAGWNGKEGVWPDWIYRARETREIVAKLPKTVDGVPIVPGMSLWLPHPYGPHEMANVTGATVNESGQIQCVYFRDGFTTRDKFYSTREAAEAASEMEVCP